ncbi:MAG: PDZ domain-containing protein [Xanthomonadaceae bacterium]|nr:PDZ domain-containing protein [Rhodospirillaceae bacterium]NIA17863.1 PDZ domain-containing protein [Xanthomonadaceae bacterium]
MLSKKSFNFSFRNLIIILVVASLIGGGIIYVGVKTISYSIYKYQKWGTNKHNGFFSELKEVFEKKAPQNIQPIKIVDEQSQVIKVVKKASPAVVSIVASAEVPVFENYFGDPLYGVPKEFQRFFNFRIPEQKQKGTKKQRIGAGTGFLVSSDGYIITNKHVVEDEKAEYTVYLNNKENRGDKIKAKVLARDPNNDLAVLKIDKKNLPYLKFGDSNSLQVGQTAITIGYALGEFDNTVSKGVISGLSRTITAGGGFNSHSERLKNLIQTDAAINPGNSGGPMLDIDGDVIGINVAMVTAENIGFAIPGNDAKDVFDQVKKTGIIKKKEIAFLGVRYIPITEELRSKNKLPYDYGALIIRGDTKEDLAVVPGSPADKAGIVENDIILKVDGKKVTLRNQLVDLISKYKPGDKITLKVYHKGKEKEVKVNLGKN